MWGQLPIPDHFNTISHIIGGKLTLIGGQLIATNKMANTIKCLLLTIPIASNSGCLTILTCFQLGTDLVLLLI